MTLVATRPPRMRAKKPRIKIAKFLIRGTTPLVQNRWQGGMMQTCTPDTRTDQEKFEDAQHISGRGWNGIPTYAFNKALVAAFRIVGLQWCRGSIHSAMLCIHDGLGRKDGVPLVRITKGEPELATSRTYFAGLRKPIETIRAMWDVGWEATVRIQHDADSLSRREISQLLLRAGIQVGIGYGRFGVGEFSTERSPRYARPESEGNGLFVTIGAKQCPQDLKRLR